MDSVSDPGSGPLRYGCGATLLAGVVGVFFLYIAVAVLLRACQAAG